MGNRSYLNIKTTDGNYRNLFEGNNSLAHFWLMLLDQEDLENSRSLFNDAFANFDFTSNEPIDIDIVIDKETALKNASKRSDYIENVYPELSTFYQEWLDYLSSLPALEFYIDLAEMLGFYESPDDCIDELIEIVAEIDDDEPTFDNLICETSGWEGTGSDSFLNFSKAYADFPEIKDMQQHRNEF